MASANEIAPGQRPAAESARAITAENDVSLLNPAVPCRRDPLSITLSIGRPHFVGSASTRSILTPGATPKIALKSLGSNNFDTPSKNC